MLEPKDRYNNVEMPIYYIVHTKNKEGIQNLHYHTYVEILYILDGESHVQINDTDYFLKTGDLIIINSCEEHETCAVGEKVTELVVKFEPDTLNVSEGYAYNFRYILPVLFSNNNHNRLFRKAELENTFIPKSLINGAEECKKAEYGFEIAMKTEVMKVFLWIIRRWKSNGEISANLEKNVHILEPALQYACQEYFSATALTAAKHCNLSYAYFSKLFKKTFKRSFVSHINDIRIAESKKLLLSTNKSITEIASETGFSTTSYFIQVFRQTVGETPYKYKIARHQMQ